MLLSLALVVAAVPALNVALPNLASDTAASRSEPQWIVDAYALVFAALLLPAGALGDSYGRKPVLILGLVVFALGSAAASFAEDPETLMVLRGVMWVGSALVMPTTLSIITSSFPADLRVGRSVRSVWPGRERLRTAGVGALLEVWDWPSVLLFNAVVAAVAAVGAIRRVPNSRGRVRPRSIPRGRALGGHAGGHRLWGIVGPGAVGAIRSPSEPS